MPPDDFPIVGFPSRDDWDAWLARRHATSPGIWMKIAKKGAPHASVSYAEAVVVALRWGWIDGQRGRLDEHDYLQRFTPRRARSRWSKINRDMAARLIDAGQMMPSGAREVEAAKADGRWEAAYAGQRSMEVPDDLRAALAASPAAEAFFATISAGNRYAILYRVHDAKRPETRARRIATFVAMLADGKTVR